MMPQVFAHEGEATGSGMILPNMMGGTEEATFTHFMGDMVSFHWGNWSPFFIILWWLTWILIIIALVVFIRWLWIKGGQKDDKSDQKGKADPFVLGIFAFAAIAVVGGLIFAFTSTSNQAEITKYDASASERPKLKLEGTNLNLGTMKVSDKKVKDITLENTGNKPLQVTNVSTSCGCTSAQIVIGGEESPIFSMHGNPSWVGEIAPGKKAILKAIYEPAKHPVQGRSEKTIFFKTNDPENSNIQINLTAIVE